MYAGTHLGSIQSTFKFIERVPAELNSPTSVSLCPNAPLYKAIVCHCTCCGAWHVHSVRPITSKSSSSPPGMFPFHITFLFSLKVRSRSSSSKRRLSIYRKDLTRLPFLVFPSILSSALLCQQPFQRLDPPKIRARNTEYPGLRVYIEAGSRQNAHACRPRLAVSCTWPSPTTSWTGRERNMLPSFDPSLSSFSSCLSTSRMSRAWNGGHANSCPLLAFILWCVFFLDCSSLGCGSFGCSGSQLTAC